MVYGRGFDSRRLHQISQAICWKTAPQGALSKPVEAVQRYKLRGCGLESTAMPAPVRKVLLFSALAAVAGYLVLDRPASGPQVATVQTDRATARPNTAELELPARRALSRARGELFGAPPVTVQKAAPVASAPPAPAAPPVPYRFAGRVLKGAEEEVLVSKGELVFPVKVGDTLDGAYKVASISAERIELVYLPLGTADRIVVTSALEAERAPSALGAVSAPAPAPAPALDDRPAQLRWEGPDRVQAGSSFSVALRVSTKEALRAAPMQLRFEPGVLEALEVRPGKFFDQGNFAYRVNAQGSIFVGATAPGGAPGRDAELLVVTFKSIKAGATAELNVTSLSLQGVAGRMVAHDRVATFRVPITQ